MTSRVMSDAEIRRRKKAQGHISQVTGGLGLAALGGTMVASRTGRNTLRKIPAVKPHLKKPPPKDPNRDRIKGGLTPLLATSAGLGGLGAFNFAAYTNAESRKRKTAVPPKKKVTKRADEMAPTYGEVAKAWTPQTTPFDPEAKRAKRADRYQAGLGLAGGAALGGAAVTAGQAGSARAKVLEGKETKKKMVRKPDAKVSAKKLKGVKQMGRNQKIAVKNIKSSGKLAAVGAGAIGANRYVAHRKKSESWSPYAKRDSMSAFGVDHQP